MTITATTLNRAAGLAAVVGGLLYVAVQINHPHLDLTFITTAEWKIRQAAKIGFAALSLAGITGMYLRQVKQIGVLGLIGYVLFAVNFLTMLSIEIIGVVVLPAIASSAPGYVSDVLAVATLGKATGDIGLLQSLIALNGVTYIGGGLVFGIALFRANVLARWATALLAAGTVATLAIPLLPQVNFRLFAIPTGIAMACLGYSLWREQRTLTARPLPSPVGSQLDAAGAK